MKPKRNFFALERLFLLWSVIVIAFTATNAAIAVNVYVSVDGKNRADGSLSNPFGSLPEAVRAVRGLREAGNNEPAVIYLREGRHQLDQTLVLGLGDGSPKSPSNVTLPQHGAGETIEPAFLTLAAYPGEHPVVSAGVPVTDWQRLDYEAAELPSDAAGKVWVADIPKVLKSFYTLYDAHGRLNRARGDGFLPTKNGDSRTVYFPKGALKKWSNLEDVEVQVRPSVAYEINMLPLESVDENSGIAKTGVSASHPIGNLPPYLLELMGDEAASVWVENALEYLDEPGEWVVNTRTRKIYLWPANPAADGSPQGILAPATSELIRVEGNIDLQGPTDTPVRGIAFSGLTFSHADRWAWTSDEAVSGWGLQHAWEMFDKPTALLRFRGTEDCRVSDCRFIHSGGTGVRLDLHAQRNRITGSEFAHLGEAGILLVGYGVGTKDVNHHNEIVNNYLHHFSEITWQSPGFWAWQSGHNRIAHNELSHSGYCSVVISTRSAGSKTRPQTGAQDHDGIERDRTRRRSYEGWKRREKYLHSRHNLFEYNEISHSVQLLSDGNGVYVSGTGTGNIIRYNYLHDNQSGSLPAAIRCDDDQHETLIYGNVLYQNAGHAAAIASKGVNDIINNFIVGQTRVPRNGYISFEWVPVVGSKVERNIIISHPDGGLAHSERMRKGQTRGGPEIASTEMDANLYFHPTDPHWVDEHLAKMRAIGKENASLVGDPLFVAPANGDFSFRPGSPALELGIEPLDVSKMGRTKDRSLLNSDGSVFTPQDIFPKFSWETTPVYYMFGDKERVLTADEVEFIAARTDFLCIEKSHGWGELGAAELGAKHEAAAFRKANPDIKVLFYFNSAYAFPYTSYSKEFTKQGLQANPDLKTFLLTNPNTGDLASHHGGVLMFDILNPDFRDWWVHTVAKGVEESGCDGVFIDQMHGNVRLRRDKADEIQRLMGDMMAALKAKLGPEKILLGNNACSDDAKFVHPVCDAIMFENFADVHWNKEQLLADWNGMLRNAKQGKVSVFRLGVEGHGRGFLRSITREEKLRVMPQLSKEKLEYALACYLIGAQPYSYFMYSWAWTLSDGALVDYPELKRPLGPPQGAYQRTTPDGWGFTREFEHASVWVNTETRQSKITWKE